MPKEISSSHEGKDQRPDSPTRDGTHSQGKVRDFATRPQTYQYAKGDFFTLRSGQRVLRLRGGADDYDDYGDSYDTGGYGGDRDSYDTGGYGDNGGYRDSYHRGEYGDDGGYTGSYHTGGYADDGGYADPSDLGANARRSPERDWYSQLKERMEFSQRGRSLSPARDHHLTDREGIHPGSWFDEQEGTSGASLEKSEQEQKDEREAFEAIKAEALKQIQWLRMKDEEVRQHGDGGGDGGNRGVRDGYDNSSDEDDHHGGSDAAHFSEIERELEKLEIAHTTFVELLHERTRRAQEVDRVVALVQAEPKDNKAHHIFDNPEHLWDLTGLDQQGNWDLIRTTLLNKYEDAKGAVQPYEVEEKFGNYIVTVTGKIVKGALRISDAWVNPL